MVSLIVTKHYLLVKHLPLIENADLRDTEAFDLLMVPGKCKYYARKTAMSKLHKVLMKILLEIPKHNETICKDVHYSIFKKYILLIMLLHLSHFSSSLFPSTLHPTPPTSIPPALAHVHESFGFSISYTILNLPLSIFYLPLMLLILCTVSPIPPTPSSTLLITFHVISISVNLFLF